MDWFWSFWKFKHVASDVTANLLADHEKGETLESLRWKRFTYRELASATQKFKNMIGEGTHGCVYKGLLKSGELVAVKLLKEENQEFDVEALMFSHSNLVTMIDYCRHGDQRFLVSEYMPLGSLQNHLFDLKPKQEPIDWDTRLKIAIGVARGLEYLHCNTNPPVIYRNLKASNILLDNDFNPKLSDFGLVDVKSTSGVANLLRLNSGYYALEYCMTGKWTLKGDIYSFGVVLLELITGRKAFDSTRKQLDKRLVSWCQPFLKKRKKFIQLLDPLLQGRVPVHRVKYVVEIASMCLQERPSARPLINDVVVALNTSTVGSVSTLIP